MRVNEDKNKAVIVKNLPLEDPQAKRREKNPWDNLCNNPSSFEAITN